MWYNFSEIINIFYRRALRAQSLKAGATRVLLLILNKPNNSYFTPDNSLNYQVNPAYLAISFIYFTILPEYLIIHLAGSVYAFTPWQLTSIKYGYVVLYKFINNIFYFKLQNIFYIYGLIPCKYDYLWDFMCCNISKTLRCMSFSV